MEYEYYKERYKSYNFKLNKISECRIIELFDNYPGGPKELILLALEALEKSTFGGVKNENIHA